VVILKGKNMALHSIDILFRPTKAWRDIAGTSHSLMRSLLMHTVPWALIPAVCWFYGVTQVGWQIGQEPHQKMTADSALFICAVFYFAMIAGVVFLGYMIHWMAETYAAASSTLGRGVTIITYTATPFFLAGLLGLYPALWLDISIGVAIGCYCVYLLYLGVPIVMDVQPERGFLFASAVVAIALVSVVGLMTATAILWDFGAEPVYTY
jgi:Yip1 domain